MRRFALILTLFLAAAGIAVAQVPLRFLPADITGRDSMEATTIEALVTLSVGGYPVATSGSIPTNYVTTDTTQSISGAKTFTSSVTLDPLVSIQNSGSANDIFIKGPVSIQDSAGTTQVRIGSVPEFPNGLTSNGQLTVNNGGRVRVTMPTAGVSDQAIAIIMSSGTNSTQAVKVVNNSTRPAFVSECSAAGAQTQVSAYSNGAGSSPVASFSSTQAAVVPMSVNNSAGGLAVDISGDVDVAGDVGHVGDYDLDGSMIVRDGITSNRTALTGNEFYGYLSGNTTMTGGNNVGVGRSTFASITSGASNVAIGSSSQSQNTSSSGNVSVGMFSMQNLDNGSGNTAIGANAMQNLSGGTSNVIIGNSAMATATGTVTGNVGVGSETVRFATSGSYNTALGWRSMRGVTSGSYNVGVGIDTLFVSTSGSNNVAIGHQAGYTNTTESNRFYLGGWNGSTQYPLQHWWEVNVADLSENSLRAYLNRNEYRFALLDSAKGSLTTTSLNSPAGVDLVLRASAGQTMRLQDAAGIDQFVISSIPNAPNGLLSQGEMVLTSVSAVQGFVTTDTAQTISGQKSFTNTVLTSGIAPVGAVDMFIRGPVSVQDSTGTTQVRVGSRPEFPNGFSSLATSAFGSPGLSTRHIWATADDVPVIIKADDGADMAYFSEKAGSRTYAMYGTGNLHGNVQLDKADTLTVANVTGHGGAGDNELTVNGGGAGTGPINVNGDPVIDGDTEMNGTLDIIDATGLNPCIAHQGSGGGDWWVQKFGDQTSTTGWKWLSGSSLSAWFYRSNLPYFGIVTGGSNTGIQVALPIRAFPSVDMTLRTNSSNLVGWLVGANDDFYIRDNAGNRIVELDRGTTGLYVLNTYTMYPNGGLKSSGANDLTLQPAVGQALRLRDATGADQFIIASIPNAPNGLLSQGYAVLTSVSAAQGFVTTDTNQTISGIKTFNRISANPTVTGNAISVYHGQPTGNGVSVVLGDPSNPNNSIYANSTGAASTINAQNYGVNGIAVQALVTGSQQAVFGVASGTGTGVQGNAGTGFCYRYATTQGSIIDGGISGTLAANNTLLSAGFLRQVARNGFTFTNPLMQVADQSTGGTDGTPILNLRWTSVHGAGKPAIQFDLPGGQTAGDYLLKLVGPVNAFEVDALGNIDTDGDIDAGGYTSSIGGASEHPSGIIILGHGNQLSRVAASGVAASLVSTDDNCVEATSQATGVKAAVYAQTTGGIAVYGRCATGSNNQPTVYGVTTGLNFAVKGEAAGGGPGGGVYALQSGTLAGNNNQRALYVARGTTLNGFAHTQPTVEIDDSTGAGSNTDMVKMTWSAFSTAGGKSFILFNPDNGSGLDADDFLFKRANRTDFQLDLAGHLRLPGSVTLSPISTPAAPAAGGTFFVDSNRTPSYKTAGGATSALISEFHGVAQEDEISTNNTEYTTVASLTVPVYSNSGRRMHLWCELAGQDTSTRCNVRVRLDHSQVLSECNYGFDSTYASGGWQSHSVLCFATASAGTHYITISINTTNAAKTVYVRRVRATCERVY